MINEAVANLRARALLTLVMIAILGSPVIGGSVREMLIVGRIVAQQGALDAAGFSTLRISQDEEFGGHVDADDCVALAAHPAIRQSTWVGDAEDGYVLGDRGPVLRVISVGPQMSSMLRRAVEEKRSTIPIWVGNDADLPGSRSLRWQAALNSEADQRWVSTVDLRFLGPGFTAVALAPEWIPPEQGASCVAITSIYGREQAMAAMQFAFPIDLGYRSQFVLELPEELRTPAEELSDRATRRWSLFSALSILVTWGLYLRLRKDELAFYVLGGVSWSRLTLMLVAEVGLLLTFTGVTQLGLALHVWLSGGDNQAATAAAIAFSGRTLLWGTPAMVLFSALFSLRLQRRIGNLAKDR